MEAALAQARLAVNTSLEALSDAQAEIAERSAAAQQAEAALAQQLGAWERERADLVRQLEELHAALCAEKAAREFVEQIGADAVVILWTVQNKRMTKFWRHQIGNGILCNALIEKTAEEQQEAEIEEEEEEDD
jgi:uncharacterized protein involved in exopolysaccharide biosynthesis